MWAYTIRRLLLMIPTILGIMLITFILFGIVAKDPALQYAGRKATPQVLASVRHEMGLDKPKWLNIGGFEKTRHFSALFDSQFMDILLFRFSDSMEYQESVWSLFARKAPVSLAIQLPAFIIELGLQLGLAMICASLRNRWQDRTLTILAVAGMSVPSLCIYMAFQDWLGAQLRIFPVAGWGAGWYAIHFAALPILATVIGSLGGGVRFFRTIALDEIYSDYVRTGRAKGVSEGDVLLVHVFRNLLVPVITVTVTTLPLLFTGALVLEIIFQIPGLGNLMYEAIFNNDRPVIMFLVYIISIIYCLALVATDICYALADPRVRLQ
ncbi:MAG TPA: ABC transporter permease [Tepidisphaeraceae bacterium]|nr:ABC transporter permease [Tepidisphaeraceae bacterium]